MKTSREVVAIVDVQARVYGECGHIVSRASVQHKALNRGEALRVDFVPEQVVCADCKRR